MTSSSSNLAANMSCAAPTWVECSDGERDSLMPAAVAQPELEHSRIRLASERRPFSPWYRAVAVRRHVASAMEQGEVGFLLRQHGQEVGEGREDRETHTPAVAVARPEQRDLPHDVGPRHLGRELTLHSLSDDEAEVVGQAVGQPLLPVACRVGMGELGLHPDLSVTHLDQVDWYIVRPQVEGAAAFDSEASVVPMTGQDAIFDAAALEREAHVGATIVEGDDASAVVDHEDRTMVTVHHDPPLRPQLLETASEREFRVRRLHELASHSCAGVLKQTIVATIHTREALGLRFSQGSLLKQGLTGAVIGM